MRQNSLIKDKELSIKDVRTFFHFLTTPPPSWYSNTFISWHVTNCWCLLWTKTHRWNYIWLGLFWSMFWLYQPGNLGDFLVIFGFIFLKMSYTYFQYLVTRNVTKQALLSRHNFQMKMSRIVLCEHATIWGENPSTSSWSTGCSLRFHEISPRRSLLFCVNELHNTIVISSIILRG